MKSTGKTSNRVAVIGLGYVGLPLALLCARMGYDTVGYDIDADLISELQDGKTRLTEDFIESWMNQAEQRITYTTDASTIQDCNIKIICVPTPVRKDKLPNLELVKKATQLCKKHLQGNDLVIIESTIYPGVCRELVLPILKTASKNFYLAHCPERINPGDIEWNVSNIPRVIGSIKPVGLTLAQEFYDSVIDAEMTSVSTIEAAEATKILENTYRDVNIAFVNEMAKSFYHLGIPIDEVIKGASTKPYGFQPHYPGVGVGGHCIAVDPYYMIQKGADVGFDHELLKKARKVNSEMPMFTLRVIQDVLNSQKKALRGSHIAILGLAYKPDVADDRESPSYELIDILNEYGAEVHTYDPYFPNESTANSTSECIQGSDCVVIATAHKEFLNTELYKKVSSIVDGRNCLDKQYLRNHDIEYRGIGIR